LKSYSNHLVSTQTSGEILPNNYYPTMRSSAIFPARLIKGKIDTIITFMGYWLLKRDIKEITAILTIRSSDGTIVIIESKLIDCVKSFNWSIDCMLNKSDMDFQGDFFGSVEVEIYSARDMVYPYPAITFSYTSQFGNTFVHTAGRIYTNLADMEANNEQVVAETGFDIISKKDYYPYFSFVNGPIEIKNTSIDLEFINIRGESLVVKRFIEHENSYSTIWINLLENEIERSFFNDQRGTVKIYHNLVGFFPRFVVGNVYKKFEAISLSHSYYDSSADKSDLSTWKNPNQEEFFDSVLSFPISFNYDYTELVVYPNFSQKDFNMIFEFYNEDGVKVGTSSHIEFIKINEKSVKYIDCRKLLEEINSEEKLYLCKVISDGGGEVPSRLKFGLNIGMNNNEILSSNICFNAKVPFSYERQKKGTFRWCPVFDANYQSIFFHDCSLLRKEKNDSELDISYWRESDDRSLTFKTKLAANGVKDILSENRDQVSEFLNNDIGWVTIRASSPYNLGYYVTNYENGLIGADHVF
jgi:hypothetical protein